MQKKSMGKKEDKINVKMLYALENNYQKRKVFAVTWLENAKTIVFFDLSEWCFFVCFFFQTKVTSKIFHVLSVQWLGVVMSDEFISPKHAGFQSPPAGSATASWPQQAQPVPPSAQLLQGSPAPMLPPPVWWTEGHMVQLARTMQRTHSLSAEVVFM